MQEISKKFSIDDVSIKLGTDKKIYASGYKEVKMFSGAVADIGTYWPGWQLCDGTNGTPDLRDRFVIAAGGAYAPGATGDGSIPAHEHTITRLQGSGIGGSDSYSPADTVVARTSRNNEGTAWVADPNSPAYIKAASYGSGTKNIATYYALCFIQKV